jgi:surface antigen
MEPTMTSPGLRHPLLVVSLCMTFVSGAIPRDASAQFGKRLLQIGACAGGAVAGLKFGEMLAQLDAKRLNLSPADAKKRERAYKIGLGLALCGGGAAIAGTVHGKLSERGKKAREQELLAAVNDTAPSASRSYQDPERPGIQGRVTANPIVTEGTQECRIVEDVLAEGTANDTAYVKYCRTPGGAWEPKLS